MTSARKRLIGAAALAAAAGAAATAGVVFAARRLAAADDPEADEGLALPAGAEPFTVVTDDGAELAGLVCGDPDGPTVVLAHCWLGSHLVWGPVARRLAAAGHRVVVYDQRGHAQSTMGNGEVTIARLGADLAAVLEHVDATDAVVAGHSMGGMAAAALAVEHPVVAKERVKALVLVATAVHGIGLHRRLQSFGEWAIGLGAFDRVVRGRQLGLLTVRGASGKVARPSAVVGMREIVAGTAPATRVACLRAMHRMDLRSGMAAIDVPVTVLGGSRDGLVPPALTAALAEAIPNAELEVFPGAGHMLPLEDPDRVAAIIAAHAAHAAHTPFSER